MSRESTRTVPTLLSDRYCTRAAASGRLRRQASRPSHALSLLQVARCEPASDPHQAVRLPPVSLADGLRRSHVSYTFAYDENYS